MNTKMNTKLLAVTAMLMAMNIALSSFGVPVPGGHFYLNDIVICTAALLLPPFAAFAAGSVGAFLGDLFFYPTPMFVTLVVRAVQVLAITLCVRKLRISKTAAAVLGVAIGAVIMVVGYSLGRAYIYATPEYAVLKLPYQILQAVIGAIVSVPLYTSSVGKTFHRMFWDESIHKQKVDFAYHCYKPEFAGMFFPGGKFQAEKIITSLCDIYGLDLNLCDKRKYHNILTIYCDVVTRKIITHSSDKLILASLQEKHGDLIKSENIAKKTLAFVTLNMANADYSLDTIDAQAALDFMMDTLSQAEQLSSQNTDLEKRYLEDPEYGLVAAKPIYTSGIDGSKKYLNHLKSALGEDLSWKRRGSISLDGVNGMIDIYDSFLSSGEVYKTIYINMYGSSNSVNIPQGFTR